MSNNGEQIRDLTNKVTLAGKLAELSEMREGTTTSGIPYISFNGAVQCGDTPTSTVRFKTFVKSKKSDGTDSKAFANVKNWYKSAVPMTKDTVNPTMVEMLGSVSDNPYVGADGKLIEATQFSVNYFGTYGGKHKAEINLEGFIYSVEDETRGEDETPTGRKRIRFISRDKYGKALDIKRIIVDKEFASELEDIGYTRGATTTLYLSLIPNQGAAKPVKAGGFGVQRVTEGKSYLEWIATGGEAVIDEDSPNALEPKLIKTLMDERKNKLDEIARNGYQGSAAKTATPATKTFVATPAATPAPKAAAAEDDDWDF